MKGKELVYCVKCTSVNATLSPRSPQFFSLSLSLFLTVYVTSLSLYLFAYLLLCFTYISPSVPLSRDTSVSLSQ